MNLNNSRIYIAGLLAVAAALRADLGTANLPDSVEGYVGWVLSGLIAGCAAILAPEAVAALKKSV